MSFIKSIEINQFRGIRQLLISDFSKLNVIVGDNNSGKTTFLEAIQLIFGKSQLSSVKNVVNQRTIISPDKNSFYTSFIKMFNINEEKEHLEFDIYAETDNGSREFEIRGSESKISGDEALQLSISSGKQRAQYKRSSAFIPDTAKLFDGIIIVDEYGKRDEKKISLTSLDSRIAGIDIKKEVFYIPSFGHLRYDLLQNIVVNPEYKKLAIDILNQFDDSIKDICYTKADDGTYLETIITKNGVNMPFSVYGDGIKKILFILNKLFDAADSILMIDEIETGLHKKYYDLLFPVIFALANKLNVQLFIATHSIEAIDAILKYGDYDNNDDENSDPTRVITLKRIDSDQTSNIVARNVTGRYVYDNRKVFEFEVRL